MMTPEDLIKSIPSWTLKDVMKAVDGIKETLGISDIALAGPAPVAASAQAAAPAEEKTDDFTIMLTGFGEGKKIGAIKVVKAFAGVPLGDAKKIVEELGSAPFELKSGVSKADADAIKKEFEQAGCTVEIK